MHSYLVSDALSHRLPLLLHFAMFVFPSFLGLGDSLLPLSLRLLFLLLISLVIAAAARQLAWGSHRSRHGVITQQSEEGDRISL